MNKSETRVVPLAINFAFFLSFFSFLFRLLLSIYSPKRQTLYALVGLVATGYIQLVITRRGELGAAYLQLSILSDFPGV